MNKIESKTNKTQRKIYDARKTRPRGEWLKPMLLIFLDDLFDWHLGFYDYKIKKYIVPRFPDCKALYWTSIPSRSLHGIERLVSR